ncbi:MAG: transglycosylase family protein [Acidimicrobiia bacterium]
MFSKLLLNTPKQRQGVVTAMIGVAIALLVLLGAGPTTAAHTKSSSLAVAKNKAGVYAAQTFDELRVVVETVTTLQPKTADMVSVELLDGIDVFVETHEELLEQYLEQANLAVFFAAIGHNTEEGPVVDATGTPPEVVSQPDMVGVTVEPVDETSVAQSPTETPPAAVVPEGGPSAGQWAALRQCESSGNYQIVSASGLYRGAYQFHQATWDSVARSAGRADLVGVRPEQAAPSDQDAMAFALYAQQGARPWPVCGRHLR